MKAPEDNLVCPIKLLLITALRLGNVEKRSIDDLLLSTQAREDKTVQWVHPERPVFVAFADKDAVVEPDRPAGDLQLAKTLVQVGDSAGLLTKLQRRDQYPSTAEYIDILDESDIVGLARPCLSNDTGKDEASPDLHEKRRRVWSAQNKSRKRAALSLNNKGTPQVSSSFESADEDPGITEPLQDEVDGTIQKEQEEDNIDP